MVNIRRLTDDENLKLGISEWPIWEKEISRFDWTYDQKEECYIIDGEFIVETDEGSFTVSPGDFVTFSKGLSCIWDIKKPVKKHYRFS